jgi:hypothetical protein
VDARLIMERPAVATGSMQWPAPHRHDVVERLEGRPEELCRELGDGVMEAAYRGG